MLCHRMIFDKEIYIDMVIMCAIIPMSKANWFAVATENKQQTASHYAFMSWLIVKKINRK